ncbi:GNAT family N-acetyltransferase [Amycolatopsis sp. H20-H5]|uniref:GNAT family N-acetyltransferase n=1 Tax=Amycolatopsis sp. H20-H5 TaxID=3046309 RepID=UPI002DBD0123|nr:GNAT family N-acetyltransferase [Amycolatopsis sp. H20-H5]MEC3973811.1 GNAT family N-acetyltransferase [Amycolatopsis sp. H20-H5]
MSEFTIRPPKPEELAAAGEVTVEAYVDGGLLTMDNGYEHELRDTARRVELAELLVAVDTGGEVLGSVTIASPGTEYAELSHEGELEFRMLAVSPAARGRGVGEALTRAVLARGREIGACRVVLCSLDSMKPAHRLYERIGFTRLPDRDWTPFPGVTLIAYGLTL